MSAILRTNSKLVLTRRFITTTNPLRKSVTETAKDTLKAADRTVSEKLVQGINASANAAEKAKASISSTANQASSKASELSGKGSGDASKATGQAKGKAQEMAGLAKGKAQELAGQAKGKAEEVKGKLS